MKRGKITTSRVERVCRAIAKLSQPIRTFALVELTTVMHRRDKAPDHAHPIYYAAFFTVVRKFVTQ